MLASLTLATFFRYENVVASNSLTCGAERRELAQVETAAAEAGAAEAGAAEAGAAEAGAAEAGAAAAEAGAAAEAAERDEWRQRCEATHLVSAERYDGGEPLRLGLLLLPPREGASMRSGVYARAAGRHGVAAPWSAQGSGLWAAQGSGRL